MASWRQPWQTSFMPRLALTFDLGIDERTMFAG